VARLLDRRNLFMAAGALAAVLLAFTASSAQAASYPAGGSTFSGSAEGWKVNSATCNVPALCTASGGYDNTAGKPPGSLAASSSIILNLGGLFKSNVVEESPQFKSIDGGPGSLRLDRQFVPGGLVPLTPQAVYTVRLLDKTTGTEAQAITEAITGESAFAGKESTVTLTEGHTYAIQIESEIDSTVAGIGLTGTSTIRFDNVVLAPVSGGGGGGKGSTGGKNGLSNVQLASLMQGSLVGPAVLKGKRLFVKAKCPAPVGIACRVSLQGLVKKGKAATATRSSKIPMGKAKQLVLKVKPKAREKVARKSRLLFKQKVKAGDATATLFKPLKLIRR
jgi:hypothetical protein